MTQKTEALLTRLVEIGQSLAQTDGGLGLLGLGSVGAERQRLDDYSDLDFFAVVEPGTKEQFLNDLSWLSQLAPISYAFKNTADGYKLLYADGIFCEFAVFEPDELAGAAYAGEQWIWRHADFDVERTVAEKRPLFPQQPPDTQWLIGEALTNLYVGLGRYHRGEKLSAMRFIQGYAVDRVVELAALLETEQPAFRDVFANERRIEQRFPLFAEMLPTFILGYEHSPKSAQNILKFLDENFEINLAMKTEVLSLCVG